MGIVGAANAAEAVKAAEAIKLGSQAMTAGWIAIVFLGALAAIVLYMIMKNKIDLTFVISEEDGSASLSRFQFLVFTFVIAASFIMVVIHTGELPNVPAGVWGLLGISGSSYVVSKGIQMSNGAKPPAAQGGTTPPAQSGATPTSKPDTPPQSGAG